ncbi:MULTISPECIES: hypothetical protein [Burkholderia]|uniref:Uncharacterized protein n=1 Tax=Burkholderia orbicola (strain MC0-3) TaxID=406425 RepID=B1KCI1_BURO0|nr:MULTISPECIES: hypothetical protein [Burkholderia]ACA95928.1 hypothetical protein Bcenmc03_6824 [Burkholderia orbicola MC0-3]MBY4798421.1 hypothetical protein [Burkholderia cepacia]MCA8088006.1 hypothetical protein [Burkholderia cenocepacia]RQV54753.1 hypothetical protein DF024_32230 [Burkholderia cenocepacia]CAG2360760.1 hypothetical protein BCCR75389_06050 [Burkholderia cenocepacia]
MYLLDSDLRGPIADYTFHYRRQFAGKNAPPLDNPDRAKQSDRGTCEPGAIVPRIFGKTRREGQAR